MIQKGETGDGSEGNGADDAESKSALSHLGIKIRSPLDFVIWHCRGDSFDSRQIS